MCPHIQDQNQNIIIENRALPIIMGMCIKQSTGYTGQYNVEKLLNENNLGPSHGVRNLYEINTVCKLHEGPHKLITRRKISETLHEL